jgi:hypothetical protein
MFVIFGGTPSAIYWCCFRITEVPLHMRIPPVFRPVLRMLEMNGLVFYAWLCQFKFADLN